LPSGDFRTAFSFSAESILVQAVAESSVKVKQSYSAQVDYAGQILHIEQRSFPNDLFLIASPTFTSAKQLLS
jgi:hypothetical protein